MRTTEINREEQVVISWLKSHGYYRVVPGPNHAIVADGKIRRMIVSVRYPEDIEPIKTLALNEHREVWVAKVEPEDDEISWSVVK